MVNDFQFVSGERFADIALLRYQLPEFDKLTLRQKCYIYCLAKATLFGRDITFDQFGQYNLCIRKVLEAIYEQGKDHRSEDEFLALECYLKQVWFSNGIYHHYGCEKFIPQFTKEFLYNELKKVDITQIPLLHYHSVDDLFNDIAPVIFDPQVLPKRVNKAAGADVVKTSACNYYQGVTQEEVENFYANKKDNSKEPPSWGLNSTLVKDENGIHEEIWTKSGRYGAAIEKIVFWLEKALAYVENDQQRETICLLVRYYTTGDLHTFDRYSIQWLKEQSGRIDFINGFIEVYGDPLGLKGSWEGIVEYKDLEATKRTQTISANAQWFEDHSPVAPQFRKPVVKGVSANVICAAMLGGDEYPSSAIGINLPNADWIRAEYGSKSVTISNLTHSYAMAAKGNGFKDEFIKDQEVRTLIDRYGDICDDLHTDLHECLGHGSGQLLPQTDPDALKNYGNTIEEARADLFALYYIADYKLVELGLTPSPEAYKAQYYEYLLNGLITQLVRIKPGHTIEEAHMRNRSLIAHWVYEHSNGAIKLQKIEGKTLLYISNYEKLRSLFAQLLAEIQRIKSEGDFEAAKQLVETYAVKVDEKLHKEVLDRYKQLNIAPYKGFINPWMKLKKNEKGEIIDVLIDYTESYTHQMLRYSKEYATL